MTVCFLYSEHLKSIDNSDDNKSNLKTGIFNFRNSTLKDSKTTVGQVSSDANSSVSGPFLEKAHVKDMCCSGESCFIEFIKQVGGKDRKCYACHEFYPFLATSFINSIIKEHECHILFIV